MHRLENCAVRVVCELMCSPGAFGPSGLELYAVLQRIFAVRQVVGVGPARAAAYQAARAAGLNFSRASNCKACYAQFGNCNRRTMGLILLANAVELVL